MPTLSGSRFSANDRDIASDPKYFFAIALNAMKDGLVILTCALLQKPSYPNDGYVMVAP